MRRILFALLAFFTSTIALSATITTDQKYLLNSKMGSVATKVQLGTLVETAQTAAVPAAASVTLSKLAPGVTFTHRVVAGGIWATVGGSATETITAAGVVASDLVICALKAKGATPRTILTCAAGTGTIAAVMSGDPSTDHVITYLVWRAAS